MDAVPCTKCVCDSVLRASGGLYRRQYVRTFLDLVQNYKMSVDKIPDSAHVGGARLQARANSLLREKGVIQSYNLASFPGSPWGEPGNEARYSPLGLKLASFPGVPASSF